MSDKKKPDPKSAPRFVWKDTDIVFEKKVSDEEASVGLGGPGSGRYPAGSGGNKTLPKSNTGKIKGAGSITEIETETTFYGKGEGKNTPWSYQQVMSLENYGQGQSGEINKNFRKGTYDADKLGNTYIEEIASDDIINIEHAFDQAPALSAPLTVYRGVKSGVIPDDVEIGDSVLDKGYLSTTYDKEKANTFAKDSGTVLEITAPEGSRYIKMSGFADAEESTAGEAELLFHHHSSITITGIGTDERGHRVIKGKLKTTPVRVMKFED